MGRKCSTHGEKRNAYSILVGKPERKQTLGRSSRRQEDNTEIDLGQIVWTGFIWLWIGTTGAFL
jgi:hypothetical protein